MPDVTIDLERKIRLLKSQVRDLEGSRSAASPATILPFGIDALDGALPEGGIGAGQLHEVAAREGGDAAARGFVAALAGRFADRRDGAPVLWCRLGRMRQENGLLYGPGLLRIGLNPERLLLVQAERPADLLWAMEEGLQCRHLAAVVGDGTPADLTASRRLQLAAGASGVAAFLIPSSGGASANSAAATRWRLASLPAASPAGEPRWLAELLRAKGGGRPGAWALEWDDAAFRFRLAAPLADRPLAAAAAE